MKFKNFKKKSNLIVNKDDLLSIYIKEIEKIKQVPYSVQKELLLRLDKLNKKLKNYAKRYKINVDELSYLGTDKRIPNKLLEKILTVISERDMIKEKIIRLNLKLVVKIAEQYRNDKIDQLDLISEGNIGLIEGIDRYNVNMGTKFSTYVSWWIKQRIRQALKEQRNTIKLPVYIYNILYRCEKIKEKFLAEFGKEPVLQELAERVSIPADKLIQLYHYIKEPVSLESELKYTNFELKYFTEDSSNITPFEIVYSVAFVDKLSKLINSLKYNEQIVIKMRFGLFGEDEYKLNEIGEYMGISAERVRQILKSGLANLKRKILEEKDFFLD